MDRLDERIRTHLKEVIRLRRIIHANPEISRQEFATASLVESQLQSLGLKVERLGQTGVVAIRESNVRGKTVLLRADMDALPITETNNLVFKSKNKEVMHACGHDVHTAILLGAAKVLSEMSNQYTGNIKYVFQPAEEDSPRGGAREMIERGVLKNPDVDAAVALHVWDLPVGTVGLRPGAMMAQSDRLKIVLRGRSSHAAQPQRGADTIVAAGHVISALQSIVARKVDPLESAVVTIGTIEGGSRYNVISDYVVMNGTIRTFKSAVANNISEQLEIIVRTIAQGLGCTAEVIIDKGYPATINDEALANKVIVALKKGLGKNKVTVPEHPSLGGEDFSFFTQKVPSVYVWLGISSEKNAGQTTLHNPSLLIDEDCIAIGIKTLVLSAIDTLNN